MPQTVGLNWPVGRNGDGSFPEVNRTVEGFSRWAMPPPPNGLRLVRRSDGEYLWVAEEKEQLWINWTDFNLFLDLARGEGKAQVDTTEAWWDVARVLYFHVLLADGGMLLHASGVIREGWAYLFPGPSGTGKSTILRLSAGCLRLADDMAAVLVAPGGDGGPPQALGIPALDKGLAGPEMIRAPLKGLYFPRQANENRLQPLTPGEALSYLMPSVGTFTAKPERLQRLFDLCLELVNSTPAWRLDFRPEPDFWQVIDGS